MDWSNSGHGACGAFCQIKNRYFLLIFQDGKVIKVTGPYILDNSEPLAKSGKSGN